MCPDANEMLLPVRGVRMTRQVPALRGKTGGPRLHPRQEPSGQVGAGAERRYRGVLAASTGKGNTKWIAKSGLGSTKGRGLRPSG